MTTFFAPPLPSPTPPVPASRFRRRKAAGETISHGQPERPARPKTARNKPRRSPTATSRQHAKAPPANASGNENEPAVGGSPPSQKKPQLKESASAPATSLTAATSDGAATAAAASTALQGKPAAGAQEEAGEEVNSPLARQRLEKAKALDEEVATGQVGGGGG